MPRRAERPVYTPTCMRAWRQHRGLSLRELAARIAEAGGDASISHASLARIERGLQPYSQPVIEAVARALDVDVASLIARDPKSPERVWAVWDAMTPEQRRQAAIILEALLQAG